MSNWIWIFDPFIRRYWMPIARDFVFSLNQTGYTVMDCKKTCEMRCEMQLCDVVHYHFLNSCGILPDSLLVVLSCCSNQFDFLKAFTEHFIPYCCLLLYYCVKLYCMCYCSRSNALHLHQVIRTFYIIY